MIISKITPVKCQISRPKFEREVLTRAAWRPTVTVQSRCL